MWEGIKNSLLFIKKLINLIQTGNDDKNTSKLENWINILV